ncbi:MAG: hypothetical protein EZS28_031059, partial [Streblomastix strix]
MSLRKDIADPDDDKLCIEDIVFHTRFARPLLTWQFLFFVLYVPFGLIIFIVRIFLILLFEFVLFHIARLFHANELCYKFYRFCAGQIVILDGKKNLALRPRIIVQNHITALDIVAIRGDFKCAAISPLFYQKFWVTKQMVKEVHPLYVRYDDRDAVRRQIKAHLQTSEFPIMCFPEGAMTSGESCLL